MRTVTIATALVIVCSLVSRVDGREGKPSDEEINKLLVGKWSVEETNGNVKIKGTSTYKKDGTLEGEATIDLGDQKIVLKVSGTWKVKDGVVTETVTKSNRPDIIKEGMTTKDTVVSINDKEYKIKSESGKETTAKRVKE